MNIDNILGFFTSSGNNLLSPENTISSSDFNFSNQIKSINNFISRISSNTVTNSDNYSYLNLQVTNRESQYYDNLEYRALMVFYAFIYNYISLLLGLITLLMRSGLSSRFVLFLLMIFSQFTRVNSHSILSNVQVNIIAFIPA